MASLKMKWLFAHSSPANAALSAPGVRMMGAPLGQRPTSIDANFSAGMPSAKAAPIANFQNAGTSCRNRRQTRYEPKAAQAG